MKILFLLISLLFTIVDVSNVMAQIEFPAFISDNMVLQQQTEVPIWGWEKPGVNVKILCSWDKREYFTTTNSKGKWQTKIKTPVAGGPYKLTINNKEIINILVGEVWLCSGQSNMQWALDQTDNSSKEIDNANYPLIRFFYAARQLSDQPQEDCYGLWTECSPNTAKSFSAVAYYFGKKIHKELNIPIGLIHTSWGGSSAQAWTKKKILHSDPDYNIYFEKQRKQELAAEPGILPINNNSPSRLYNAMIHPFIPFAIKGVIWYQGESNTGEALLYEKLFPAMIKNWRDDWQQGEFPFYFVQLAPYKYDTPFIGGLLRDSQRKSLSIRNTGMAVTLDIGNHDDIHPRNKLDVGERLALWALARDYGKNDLVYSGPLYKSYEIVNDEVHIKFTHIGGGLVSKSGELSHFELSGDDRIFYEAEAEIINDMVVVKSKHVAKPIAARYAFHNTDEPNLFNVKGLPASSFRTDNWPIITETVGITSIFDSDKDRFLIKLNSDSEKTIIRYTTDGSIPNKSSNIYSDPITLLASTILKARAFIDGIPSVAIAKSELIKHKATGRPVVYENKFSNKYNGGGKLGLVNSLRGSTNFNDGLWQGFEGEDLDVTMDLGEIQNIKTISIGCLQSIGAWIFFPRNIIVFTSENGKDFQKIKNVVNDIPIRLERNILNEFEVKLKDTPARYVKIVAENIAVCPDWHPGAGGKAWIFIDEIIID